METVQNIWGKKILVFVAIIFLLLLLINFSLNYLINYIFGSYIIPQVNNNQRELVLYASARLFPSTNISISDLKYEQNNKSIITINKISVNLDFWKLFRGKLHINKVAISDGIVNLYNIPSINWKKSTKEWTDKKPQKKSTESKKPLSETRLKDSFFELEQIELTNVQFNYSEKPTSSPFYLNSLVYNNDAPSSKYNLTVTGNWASEAINVLSAANFSAGNQLIKTNIDLANNSLNLIAQPIKKGYQLQTHLSIKNPDALAALLSMSPEQLPMQVNATVNLINNKLRIFPFQMVYSGAELHADISQSGSSNIIKLMLPESLLINLSGKTAYTDCPLSPIVKIFIKGMNTQIIIVTSQAKKSLVYINGLGIQFEGSELPSVLQKNLQSCFDYKLQGESMEN